MGPVIVWRLHDVLYHHEIRLLVAKYAVEMSYVKDFKQGVVSSRLYTCRRRQNTIDIVAALIGLYGGLMVISEWMAGMPVRFFQCREWTIDPVIQ